MGNTIADRLYVGKFPPTLCKAAEQGECKGYRRLQPGCWIQRNPERTSDSIADTVKTGYMRNTLEGQAGKQQAALAPEFPVLLLRC
ncbi:hypothetical protein scyTo_0010757 [Scyliorhinus torazame]|uniref:Uncharacterized protein n=1 Tax=Scyliorhinus torazame TaxID=75743 RepID=A0A401PB25_SCYTO|nr:hypothetical protein [Scyliorhinus torazame]